MMKKQKYAIQWVSIGDRELAINPESGGWLLLDDKCRSIISSLEQSKHITEVIQKYQTIAPSEIINLARLLEEHDLTASENMSNLLSCSKSHEINIPTHAVLNLTEACNLKCTYCYVNAGCNQTAYMKPETAMRIVDEYRSMNPGRPIHIILHGGEPLLNFRLIQQLAEYIVPYRDQVKLGIQTNATLITNEIALFFKSHDISVGVSIDGPKQLHDQTRPLQNGKSSFEQVMRGIWLLQKHHIPFGVITVLNGRNVNHIDEIVDFYLANKIYSFTFSPLQKFGRGQDDSKSYINGKQMFYAYKQLLKRITSHNAVCDDSEWIDERILRQMARSIFANIHDFMCMRAPCGAGRSTMGFGVNGDFYLCDDFINDPNFKVGSLNAGSIYEQLIHSQAVANTKFRAFKHLPRCQNCVWRGLCSGVCYSTDYYTGSNGLKETEVCVFNQLMIPYLIQQYALDPELPGLLDRQLQQSLLRKVLFYIGKSSTISDNIDYKLFEDLLKLHNIKRGDTVYLCGSDSISHHELSQFLTAVQNCQTECCLITAGVHLSDERNVLALFHSGLQDVQLQFCKTDRTISEDYIQAAMHYIHSRKRQCKKYSLILSLPADADILNHDFLLWASRELDNQDYILLSKPYYCKQSDDELNALLDTMRDYSLETKIRLNDIASEKLNIENSIFVSVQDDPNQPILLIDPEHLKGISCEHMPELF
ncbi:MAG: radical SAM protein [Candidatus Fimimorpha sp.]